MRSQKSGDRSQNEKRGSKTFQDLIVWQKAHKFVISVYKATELFPKQETYGLAAQFRRAAVSIAANIAEGFRKTGKLDKYRYMNISQGSLEECRYYLILSRDLGYLDIQGMMSQLEEVTKLLDGYSKAILASDR